MINVLVRIAVGVILAVVFGSCSNQQSLQQYYVEKTENADFLVMDIPASVLNLTESNLSNEQKEAYRSLKKLNVLAYKQDLNDPTAYEAEKLRVKTILQDEKYEELMRFGMGDTKVTVNFVGDENSIEEVILYGNYKDQGFGVIRVLGNDMKPENIAKLINAMQKTDMDTSGLEQLGKFFETADSNKTIEIN